MQLRNKTKQSRYRVIDGKTSVELKLRTPRQLFDERDPAPFRERDLDDDAARYILNSFRELKGHGNVSLQLYFESLGELQDKPQVIERAIHAFFAFEAEVKRRELKDLFSQGIKSLVIGLMFLFTCTYFAHRASGHTSEALWRSMIHEGLFIMGWVAMWKPISIFLYEWWPVRDALVTFKELSFIEVGLHPLEEPQPKLAEEPTPIRADPTAARETGGQPVRLALRDLKTTSSY
jgi:hypothetical protein